MLPKPPAASASHALPSESTPVCNTTAMSTSATASQASICEGGYVWCHSPVLQPCLCWHAAALKSCYLVLSCPLQEIP
jgi:hypothetical protein